MKEGRFVLLCFVMLAAQVVFNKFFGLSMYVMFSLLPAIIMMMPRNYRGVVLMLIAFATGFVVDFFSGGLLGLSSLALVPVALARRPLSGLVFGDGVEAGIDIQTLKRITFQKEILLFFMSCALFFIVYVWADSAGTVAFWRALLRIVLSTVVSVPLCMYVSRILRS